MTPVLKVFNNLTRSKEVFKTLTDKKVKFYSCGPTTYDFLHVGNARALVVGDLFNRIMKALGYDVTFVRNFTDVDDKIIDESKKQNVNAIEFAARWVEECRQDMNSLGMMPATHTPKVSETMPEIIAMVETLIKNGAAYVVDGEVLYHVPQFKEYGKLSKKDLESLQHGIRVEVDNKKKHPADFVLWKPAKPGEVSWESPWGKGRPGWHIECSAMAKKFLGESIDLHHGGVDLMFPHHENEIAQSEAANGCSFSGCWAHNEFLNFGSEKMSKSLGNVVTIRKFIETYGGQVLRQILLSVHYRAKMDWNDDVIERGISDVERLHQFALELKEAKGKVTTGTGDEKLIFEINKVKTEMMEELANDFNSAGALGHFFNFVRLCRRDVFTMKAITVDIMQAIDDVVEWSNLALGIINANPEKVLADIQSYRVRTVVASAGGSATELASEIEKLIQERSEAKKNKNWARSDEIRNILKEKKVALKDNPDGTVSWSFEK